MVFIVMLVWIKNSLCVCVFDLIDESNEKKRKKYKYKNTIHTLNNQLSAWWYWTTCSDRRAADNEKQKFCCCSWQLKYSEV